MLLIFAAILFSTLLVVCFKYFIPLKVNTFHAILVNYVIASLTSYLLSDKNFEINIHAPWFFFAFCLGLLFIVVFMATSKVAQSISVITSAITSKMSLVIPLTYAVLFLGEDMTALKLAAIIMAMIGVVLTVTRPKTEEKGNNSIAAIALIAVVFVGSGMVDTSFKFIEINFYNIVPPQYVMMVCYASAGLFGMIYFLFTSYKKRPEVHGRSIIAGIILGVLNYFSFIFVVDALHTPSLQSTVVFPLINVGVLLLSTFFAMVLFKERLRMVNYIGVIISILSIIVLAFQNYAF